MDGPLPVLRMTFDFDARPRLRSSWNSAGFIRGKPLTDRKISQYQKRGWYDESFREARRELMAKKAAKHRQRQGNFLKSSNGSLIYSPL